MEDNQNLIVETPPSQDTASTKPEKKKSFFNKNFILLWQGQFVSQVGSQAFAIAMLFWVKHYTGSATLMGTLLMLSMLPAVIFGPIGGTFADHYSRKKIIILTDLISGVVMTAFACTFFLLPEKKDLALMLMFIVSFVVNLLKAFFTPAVTAMLPDITSKDQVTEANAVLQSTSQISMLIGQGAGGVLFRLLGAPLLFLFDGISYILSSIASMFMEIPQNLPEKSKDWKENVNNFLGEMKIGFKYILNNPGMKMIFFSAALLNFFIAPVMIILPFYVEDFLQVKVDWYGYLIIITGVGMVLGSGMAGLVKEGGKKRTSWVSLSYLLFAATFILLGMTDNLWIAIPVVLANGLFLGFVNVNITSILQMTTESEIRGRVFGNLTTITTSIMPIGYALTGVVIDAMNQRVDLVLIGCGVMMLLLSVVIISNKNFSNFMAFKPKLEEK